MIIKRIFLILGIICCLFVAGCGKLNSNLIFNKNGTISSQVEFEIDDNVRRIPGFDVDQKIAEVRQDFQKAKITNKHNGFVAEREYSSIAEFVFSDPKLSNPSEDYGGLHYRKGYFFDMYSLDSVCEGRKDPFNEDEFYRQINFNNPYDVAIYSTVQNSINSAKMTLSIALPSPADYHNANVSEANNTILKWDLKPALINGNDVPIKVDFRIYHDDNINKMHAAIAFCLIISFISLILKLFKKDVQSIKQFAHHISILFLIAAVGLYFYLDNELKHPPQLTYADRIIKDGALDSEGRDMRLSVMRLETSAPNSLETASKILKEHGYTVEKVEAVSVQDEDGFLMYASVANEGGVPIFLYDAKYNLVVEVYGPRIGNSFLYDFRKNYNIYGSGEIDFNPAIFTMSIPNERLGDVDQNLRRFC